MLGLNTSLKGSESPPLEQRGGVMNWWHDFVSLFVPTADDGYAMRVPCGREARRAFPPGGVHGRARLHGLSSKVHQPLGGNILDAFQSDATDCSTVFLCRDHDEGLLLARAAPLALFRSTNVGGIDVNLAVSRSRPGRTKALCSLCRHVQAGSSRPKPSPRCSPMALMPFFWLMMNHIAGNMCATGCGCLGTPCPPSATCCCRRPCIETRRAQSPKTPRRPRNARKRTRSASTSPDVVTALGLGPKPVIPGIERAGVIDARGLAGLSHGTKRSGSRTCVKGIPHFKQN